MPTQFPAIIELSGLNGISGFRLNGIALTDGSGRAVSSAGDINADGISDLVIGAYHADPNGLDSGQSNVVFGGPSVGSLGTVELSALNGVNGFKLNGIAPGDNSGRSVSAAGDINADGMADFLVGAYLADPNGSYSGQSYVVFGGVSEGSIGTLEFSNLNGSNGFVLNGVASPDRSGVSVSAAGDINADGVADLLIGAYQAGPNGSYSGQSYVVFGGASVGSGGTIELSSLNGSNGFTLNGIAAGDYSGISVSSVGDINADGVADILIGAYKADPNGPSSGQTYVVFGGPCVGSTGVFELSDLNGINGFRLNGIAADDRSGFSVSSAGDVNADDVADLLIGAYQADPNGLDSGQTYVVFGGPCVGSTGVFELSDLNGVNGFRLNGIAADDRSGFSVSCAGDVNADGVGDILVGAYQADPNGLDSGQTYVVFGGPSVGGTGTLELSDLTGANGFRLNGIAAGDESGRSVSQAGDINFDGVADILVGAYLADANGADSGQSYVIFGENIPPPNLIKNSFTSIQGSTLVLTTDNLQIDDAIDYQRIKFFITNPIRCQFEYINNPSIAISQFSQDDVNQSKVAFKHDGSSATPSFDFYMGTRITSEYNQGPFAGNITFSRYPELINNKLVITEGDRVTISSAELFATDAIIPANNLVFTISNPIRGQFESTDNPGQAISQFPQSSITQAKIQFIHDGSNDAPSYRVSVSNGQLQTAPNFALVNFIAVNDPPEIVTNSFAIKPKGETIITGVNLQAIDEESNAAVLQFSIKNMTHGHFERSLNPGAVISEFFQQEVNTAAIKFFADGTGILPSFNLTVSDGKLETSPVAAAVSLDNSQSEPTIINIAGKNNTVRNAVIGATVSGFVGLLFLALKIYIKKKTDKQMQKALAGEGDSVEGQQAVYFRNVISPIANKIFKRIKIRGFTGLSDKKLEAYLDAVARIVAECHEKGVPVDDLAAMNARNQRALIDEIAKHTKQTLVPESGLLSSMTGFFKAQTNPEAMETAAPMIASLVKASWNATQDRARSYSQAQGIEMTSLGAIPSTDGSQDNPIFGRAMSQTSLVGSDAAVGVGVGAVITTATHDVPAEQYNVAELLAGFREFSAKVEDLEAENTQLKARLNQVEKNQQSASVLTSRP